MMERVEAIPELHLMAVVDGGALGAHKALMKVGSCSSEATGWELRQTTLQKRVDWHLQQRRYYTGISGSFRSVHA